VLKSNGKKAVSLDLEGTHTRSLHPQACRSITRFIGDFQPDPAYPGLYDPARTALGIATACSDARNRHIKYFWWGQVWPS
jgi:hypothetical protein